MCTPATGANPRPPTPPAISLNRHEELKIDVGDCLQNPTGRFNFELGSRWHERCQNIARYCMKQHSQRLSAGCVLNTVTCCPRQAVFSAASSRLQDRPQPQAHLVKDELHDIDKSFRQDLAVVMLHNIAPATRTKFLAQRRIAIQSKYLDGQVF